MLILLSILACNGDKDSGQDSGGVGFYSRKQAALFDGFQVR